MEGSVSAPGSEKMADLESPLLESSYRANCPGCKMQRKNAVKRGVPILELFYISVIVLCNALPISSLFPFVYFMVRDFKIAKTDKDIGFYVGYVGASFMFGRFLTSTCWGWYSDKHGRKRVFAIGTCSIVIFNTMFGFSTNFWMALVARFFLGCFNGMMGPVRAYASEICREEHQALALSMIGTLWGLGLIIGPAIGGYLAQPSSKYPKLFPEGSLFDRFPYALPCLIISIFAFISFFVIFGLPESVHNHPLENLYISKDSHKKSSEERLDKESSKFGTLEGENEGEACKVDEKKEIIGKFSMLRNWGMVASDILYWLWALHDMAYIEIFSLWAVSPKNYGGLGFTTSNIGEVLAISGVALLVFQLSIFSPLARFLGPIMMARAPAALTLPLVAVYPLIARLQGRFLWVILILASIVKNVLSVSISTGSFILLNNSVPSYQRGVANGISMTGQSLFKAIGPASAGAIFSWSQKRTNAAFLPGTWMVFFILNIPTLITVITTFEPFLPKSLNKPLPEFHNNDQDRNFERHASFSF